MKSLLRNIVVVLLAAATAFSVAAQAPQPPAKGRLPGLVGRFKTGARPTPRNRLVAATPFRPVKAPPAQVAWVPSKLSMWLNDQVGDCVTAEEAFAKATTGIFIADATVQTWASKNGVLNGADLDQVMKIMATAGFSQDGNVYNDGAYASVDYSTESVLQAAIALGTVKIGIDSSALPSGAGNNMGWVATGGTPGQFSNEDHCVSVCGFGTAQYLFSQLQVTLPSTVTPTQAGYLVYTWDTIGFVDHPWIMSTCGEAWIRNPTTIIVGTGVPTPDPPLNPPGPVPPPGPTPTPTPIPVPGTVTTITLNNPLAAGAYEIAPPGTQAAIAAANAAMAALNALANPTPVPVPGPGTLEGRVGALEVDVAALKKEQANQTALLTKIADVIGGIQATLQGKKK